MRRLAQRLRLAVDQAAALAKQIGAQVQLSCVALTRLCGVNLLTAGALAGILGPGRRFRTEAQLAAYAGVAPLEASSAGRVRHRLNRGGNRRLNALLYRIALTQARSSPAAQAGDNAVLASGSALDIQPYSRYRQGAVAVGVTRGYGGVRSTAGAPALEVGRPGRPLCVEWCPAPDA